MKIIENNNKKTEAKVSNNEDLKSTEAPSIHWYVYIILSDDGSYYTGISTDPLRRFTEHHTQKKGAKFFRGRKPKKIVYCEGQHNRSSASIREAAIKKLTAAKKKELVNSCLNASEQIITLLESKNSEITNHSEIK
ncbi:MAG: GIY-YIG nuclease family protein [Pseudomonadales bacterium]|nr:GIY-YIG nuclease family protein [Pseudomonadales bacterium]